MLVLTRKMGEVVYVGQDVEIMVVGVNSGKVRLGFRAPREVVIQRAEVAPHVAPAETDAIAKQSSSPRKDRAEFANAPPLRLFRQLGPA
jgi:carbon storage regulator